MFSTSWKREIEEIVRVLNEGGVILYPTDTIWGLGCDPENAAAVSRLFEIKGRPAQKSLILLTDHIDRAKAYIGEVPAAVGHFLSAESERPLTIIYENARNLAPGVAAQDNSVGIRVTKDAFCRAIVAAFGKPITSTSANISGLPFDGSFDSIASELLEAADHVAVWRRDDPIDSLPSRVLRVFPDGAVEVIRD